AVQVQLNGPMVELGELSYFSGRTPSEGTRLWQTDGTSAGTTAVGSPLTMPQVVQPPVVVNNRIFFGATDNSNAAQLWISDGTAAGTLRVKSIHNIGSPSELKSLTNVSGNLFFVANDGSHGAELWKSDGTAVGTTLVKDIFPGTASANPASLVD